MEFGVVLDFGLEVVLERVLVVFVGEAEPVEVAAEGAHLFAFFKIK